MSMERRSPSLKSMRSISQENLVTPWDSGGLLKVRHARLSSSDDGGAGYIEDDDTDSDGQEWNIRKKCKSKFKPRDRPPKGDPCFLLKNEPFDELFKNFSKECEIRGDSNISDTFTTAENDGDVKKRPNNRRLRHRSNTQPNMFAARTGSLLPYTGYSSHMVGRDARRQNSRSPVTATADQSCDAKNDDTTETFRQAMHAPRGRSDSHDPAQDRKIDAFPNRVLCHMAQKMLGDPDWVVGDMRPRVASMPTRPPRLRRAPYLSALKVPVAVHRVRSFVISHGGIINEGERYISNSSMASTESNPSGGASNHSGCSGGVVSHHRIIVTGESCVGKRAIIQKFLLPEGSSTDNSSLGRCHIELALHWHRVFSNHQKFNCLFNGLLRLTSKKKQRYIFLVHCGIDRCIAYIMDNVPSLDVFMMHKILKYLKT